MKQLQFWNGFYEPLELGWWIQYYLDRFISAHPHSYHTIISIKQKTVLCGYCPTEPDGTQFEYKINDDLYGDGLLLHKS